MWQMLLATDSGGGKLNYFGTAVEVIVVPTSRLNYYGTVIEVLITPTAKLNYYGTTIEVIVKGA